MRAVDDHNLRFDGLLMSKAYIQVFRWKSKKELCLMKLKSDAKFEEKLTLGSNRYRRIISPDTQQWSKLWRKTNCLFQKWHKKFGEFSHKVMLDKSSVYVLAERMHFLNKSSPSNLNFLDFPMLVWSCPDSCDFWNQESVFL